MSDKDQSCNTQAELVLKLHIIKHISPKHIKLWLPK